MAVIAEYEYQIVKQKAKVRIVEDAIEKDPEKHQELVDEWFDMLHKAVIRAGMRSEAAEKNGA